MNHRLEYSVILKYGLQTNAGWITLLPVSNEINTETACKLKKGLQQFDSYFIFVESIKVI